MASYKMKKPETRLFMGGEFVTPKSGKTFEVHNPATEELVANVYEAGPEDVDAAVEAAKDAFEGWEGLGALGRTAVLLKLADAIEANAEELDYLDAICMGKPISDCEHISFWLEVIGTLTRHKSLQCFLRRILSSLLCQQIYGRTGHKLSEHPRHDQHGLETTVRRLCSHYPLVCC